VLGLLLRILNVLRKPAIEHAPAPPPTQEELWPAVAAAFEFVGPSYEQTLRRIEARENGIRAMMTIATAITFPALTLLTGPNASKKDFGSPWFIFGISDLALLMLVGVLSSIFETIQVVDPLRLYNEMLTFTEWEFKKNALYLSGLDFAANVKTLNRLGIVSSALAVLLFIEVGCLVARATDYPLPVLSLPLVGR